MPPDKTPDRIPDRNKPLPPAEQLVQLEGHGFTAGLMAALEIERERQGVTKSEIARRLDVPPSRVTEWSTGQVVPGYDVVERWLLALGLRVYLVPEKQPAIDPNTLGDDQLAMFLWTVNNKSRRAAKAVLTEYIGGETHATAADVDAVVAHITQHPRREQIEHRASPEQIITTLFEPRQDPTASPVYVNTPDGPPQPGQQVVLQRRDEKRPGQDYSYAEVVRALTGDMLRIRLKGAVCAGEAFNIPDGAVFDIPEKFIHQIG